VLLHHSLLRDYLFMEFSRIKDFHKTSDLAMNFDFERFLEDFVLFGYFVGNDFLPNLPTFSIKEGALGVFFDTYLKLLPTFGGYLIENGFIKLGRLYRLLQELLPFEVLFVSEMTAPRGKTPGKNGSSGPDSNPLFEPLRDLGVKVEHADLVNIMKDHLVNQNPTELHFVKTLSSKDRMILHNISNQVGLQSASQGEGSDRHLVVPGASVSIFLACFCSCFCCFVFFCFFFVCFLNFPIHA